MKKVKVDHKREAKPSQDKVTYQTHQLLGLSSSDQTSGFNFPNRRDVEVQIFVNTSGSMVTSGTVVFDSDMGGEGYLSRIASSQIGVDRFQETRVLSSKEIKRRAMEALRKEIERRKKLIDMEEVETDL